MGALIVYESMFGNTRDIAIAIAEGVATDGQADCLEVGAAPVEMPDDVRLLIVGGPTHAFGMSRTSTRRDAHKYSEDPLVSEGLGIREWIDRLVATESLSVATFTTEVVRPRLPGSAARGAARRLRKAGFSIIAEPETFYVEGATGPIVGGELERARSWGEMLARSCRGLTV